MPDNLLYHYTTVEALRSIVTGDPPSLHMSSVVSMNDSMEQTWLRTVLDQGLRTGVFDIADPFWKYIKDNSIGDLFIEVYATCFSKDPHSSNQWLLYGGKGAGVAIGFDPAVLESVSGPFHLHKVVYEISKQQDILKELAERDAVRLWGTNYQQAAIQFAEFVHIDAVYCKNPSFAYEDETRLVRNLFPDRLDGIIEHWRSLLRYKTRGQFLVQYFPYELDLGKKPIRTIMLGPACPDENESTIRWMLEQYRFHNVSIQRTTATCRWTG